MQAVKNDLELTDQQELAIEKAVDAIADKKSIFKIGGYAGTGKTTVLKQIIASCKTKLNAEAMPCSFTGKAALRMILKGVIDAGTIHSLIYRYDRVNDKFYKRSKHEIEGDYFLIDEASMIAKDIWNDLLSYQKPIILVGDPGQLEPVGDDPRLMQNADIVLDKIHRQAELSSIIQLATNVRHKKLIKFNDYNKNEVIFANESSDQLLGSVDIILCGRNNTRISMNRQLRALKGFDTKKILNNGESIIVLQNNRKFSVFNGEIWTVEKIVSTEKTFGVDVIKAMCINDLKEQRVLNFVAKQFGSAQSMIKDTKRAYNYVFADYGYCITTHKSQGSEWNNVLVIDEQCPIWDKYRWRYTAVTRAAKELTIVSNGFN